VWARRMVFGSAALLVWVAAATPLAAQRPPRAPGPHEGRPAERPAASDDEGEREYEEASEGASVLTDLGGLLPSLRRYGYVWRLLVASLVCTVVTYPLNYVAARLSVEVGRLEARRPRERMSTEELHGLYGAEGCHVSAWCASVVVALYALALMTDWVCATAARMDAEDTRAPFVWIPNVGRFDLALALLWALAQGLLGWRWLTGLPQNPSALRWTPRLCRLVGNAPPGTRRAMTLGVPSAALLLFIWASRPRAYVVLFLGLLCAFGIAANWVTRRAIIAARSRGGPGPTIGPSLAR